MAQLALGETLFRVKEESPEHDNFSPQTPGRSTERPLLVANDPNAVLERALMAGTREVYGVEETYGWLLERLVDPFGDHKEIGKTPTRRRHRKRSQRVKRNRSIPPSTVVPVLGYPDVREAVAWLSEAFGFVERTRVGESHRAQLSIGTDGAVIVAEVGGERHPPQLDAVTLVLKVRVDDVNAQHEWARVRGTRILEPPSEREYGERECTIEDLAGYRWQFTETIRDVASEECGCQTVARWPHV